MYKNKFQDITVAPTLHIDVNCIKRRSVKWEN
jgi:hypothetical protein